jgi:uncharacterized protein YjaZ
MTKLFVYFCVFLLLASCASTTQQPVVAPTTQPVPQSFQIINLGPAFSTFWEQAQGKRFSEQEKIWERVIEKPNREFYDSMVWMKSSLPQWKERRKRLLKKYFHKYRKLAPEMKELFAHFDQTLSIQIDSFKNMFSGFEVTVPVYAAPTASFNGRASEGVTYGKQPVLAFGMDVAADFRSDPNILYSHELFHVYHNGFLKLEKQKDTSLLLSLWMEGFATYVSLKMNPSASLNSVFMSAKLPKVKQKDIPWLAQAFLKDLHKDSIQEIYQKWFNEGSKIRPRKNLPDRCGYLLGFYVVAHLAAGNYSVDEMVHWDAKTAESQVTEALKEL